MLFLHLKLSKFFFLPFSVIKVLSERLCTVQGHFQGSLCLSKNILQTHRPKSKKARHVVKLEPFTTLRITGASCVNGS